MHAQLFGDIADREMKDNMDQVMLTPQTGTLTQSD